MYVEKLYTYGNIVSYKDTISYYYQVIPMSTLFSSDTQLDTAIMNLFDKITKINMPGTFIIRSRKQDVYKIIQDYEELYQAHGDKRLEHLKDIYMNDLKKQLLSKVRYNYEIYVCFSDNRPELKKKRSSIPLQLKYSQDPLSDERVEICKIIEEEIYKKMSNSLSVNRCNEEMCEDLHNYIAIPYEKSYTDYYIQPTPTHLEYKYLDASKDTYESLFSRVLIASEFSRHMFDDGYACTIVNQLQLGSYPVDTIVKFDLEPTDKFKQEMTAKVETIKKGNKLYFRSSGRNDRLALEAKALAKAAENVDESIEESKLRWQMMFRIRASSEDMLAKRSADLIRRFAGKDITLTYQTGHQEELHNNLFPWKQTFHQYDQCTDIFYLCKFNLFGGMYVGEDSGTILTYTMPGSLPVREDFIKISTGATKNASTTAIAVGETGGGKSQLINNEMMLAAIFYGMPCLIIDPKDDRSKLIDLLGDNATNLVLGGDDCPAGLFDAFLIYGNKGETELISYVQKDVMSLIRAVNPEAIINLEDIAIAYRDMRDDFHKGTIPRMTMTRFTQYYHRKDALGADNLLGLKYNPLGKLFFADDDTDNSSVFNLSKPFNFITFYKKITIAKFDANNLEHQAFSLCTGRITEIVYSFIALFKGHMKYCLLDEYSLWKRIPGGQEIGEDLNRIGRSELFYLRIISQLFTDFSDGLLTNTGQFMIGSLKNENEINAILSYFNLNNNSMIRTALTDHTKDEGVDEAKKYNFLYIDSNNRKGLTKLKFLNLFEDAFNTYLKNVPSDGTNEVST